jgi:hypothetical protein
METLRCFGNAPEHLPRWLARHELCQLQHVNLESFSTMEAFNGTVTRLRAT